MNVEKMIKRDISVEIANYLTNNLPCYEKKNIDDEKTYETNFLKFFASYECYRKKCNQYTEKGTLFL